VPEVFKSLSAKTHVALQGEVSIEPARAHLCVHSIAPIELRCAAYRKTFRFDLMDRIVTGRPSPLLRSSVSNLVSVVEDPSKEGEES
jgi:hypothetical protein